MRRLRHNGIAALCAAALIALTTGAPVHSAVADDGLSAELTTDSPAYQVDIGDVAAKVGEPAVLRAKLKIRDGYRILKAYNNRVHSLSTLDESVAFERRSFLATVEGDSLVFDIALKATKPGKHVINGLIRVGYIQDPGEMSMVSMPLIANVTGAQ